MIRVDFPSFMYPNLHIKLIFDPHLHRWRGTDQNRTCGALTAGKLSICRNSFLLPSQCKQQSLRSTFRHEEELVTMPCSGSLESSILQACLRRSLRRMIGNVVETVHAAIGSRTKTKRKTKRCTNIKTKAKTRIKTELLMVI